MKNVLLALSLSFSGFVFAQTQVPDTEFSFELPSDKWESTGQNQAENLSFQMWNLHPGIEDKDSTVWHPSITYIRQDLQGEEMDIILYYAMWKSRIPEHNLEEILTWENCEFIDNKNILVTHITYMDDGSEHSVYDVYALSEGYGIQLIMDCPTSLKDKVFPTFQEVINSVKVE